MAFLTETGKIRQRGEIKQGTAQSGRDWAFQEILLEVTTGNNQYKNLAVKADIHTIGDLQKVADGTAIEVTYYVDSREYNGRWYTEAHLYSFKVASEQPERHVGGSPFPKKEYNAAPAPAAQSAVNQDTDLPL